MVLLVKSLHLPPIKNAIELLADVDNLIK